MMAGVRRGAEYLLTALGDGAERLTGSQQLGARLHAISEGVEDLLLLLGRRPPDDAIPRSQNDLSSDSAWCWVTAQERCASSRYSLASTKGSGERARSSKRKPESAWSSTGRHSWIGSTTRTLKTEAWGWTRGATSPTTLATRKFEGRWRGCPGNTCSPPEICPSS